MLGVKARSGIAQAAALVTVLTTASALLGFLRDVVIAGVFGAGGELDAYLVAQGLMNLVLALVAGAMGLGHGRDGLHRHGHPVAGAPPAPPSNRYSPAMHLVRVAVAAGLLQKASNALLARSPCGRVSLELLDP